MPEPSQMEFAETPSNEAFKGKTMSLDDNKNVMQ
jgi:hypothetical protein